MRIEWALACRYFEVNGGLATIVGAGYDSMQVKDPSKPVRATFVVRLAVGPADQGDHALTASVMDPHLALVGKPLSANVKSSGAPHKQPGWEGHHFVGLVVQFRAAEPGTYTVHFAVGDSSVDYPLIVSHPAPGT